MFETIVFAAGITAIMLFVAWIYYWRGFNSGAIAYSELLLTYEPEALERLTKKLIDSGYTK